MQEWIRNICILERNKARKVPEEDGGNYEKEKQLF